MARRGPTPLPGKRPSPLHIDSIQTSAVHFYAELFCSEVIFVIIPLVVLTYKMIPLIQAGRSRVRDPMKLRNSSLYLILPDPLGPGVYSASKRNTYQKHKNVFGE
jgi:hypothetical protein